VINILSEHLLFYFLKTFSGACRRTASMCVTVLLNSVYRSVKNRLTSQFTCSYATVVGLHDWRSELFVSCVIVSDHMQRILLTAGSIIATTSFGIATGYSVSWETVLRQACDLTDVMKMLIIFLLVVGKIFRWCFVASFLHNTILILTFIRHQMSAYRRTQANC